MDCATDDTLAALLGERPALHAAMVEPPARLRDPHPARSGGRTHYGTPYDDHLDTEHFTINWWTADVTDDMAQRAGEALETAWTALVEEQGWTPPVSSDRFYLWVLLDPSLGSTTGFTTEYTTELYPDGYPIVFLNPDWGDDEAFWAALAAHEFAHALQYAVRDFDVGGTEETWYWEASATWSSELADPTVDGHQYTAAWYATQPELRYDSYEGSHQYGIFVLNAWLDEFLGPGTMAAAWALASDRPGRTWDQILEESTGQGAGELWAGFTGAFGNDRLAESDLYFGVQRRGAAVDGATSTLPYLGTDYWYVQADARIEATGDVVLADSDEAGGGVTAAAGEMVAVTALADDVDYTLVVEAARGDTGSGDTGDTGSGDTGDTSDTSDTGIGDTGREDSGSGGTKGPRADGETPAACGCTSPGSPVGAGPLLVGLLVLRRRRS